MLTKIFFIAITLFAVAATFAADKSPQQILGGKPAATSSGSGTGEPCAVATSPCGTGQYHQLNAKSKLAASATPVPRGANRRQTFRKFERLATGVSWRTRRNVSLSLAGGAGK